MRLSPNAIQRAAGRVAWSVALVLLAVPMTAGDDLDKGLPPTLPNPILFVTQFPIAQDFATIGSTFANHRAGLQDAGRGGDLYIRYGDGTLRNLTREAGYGNAGFQGAGAIAVRDPHLHWDGARALFSMAIGAPTQQYQVATYYWQIYEISGFGLGETAAITRVSNQPVDYNNVEPIYSPDGRLIFTSDRPRSGQRHLYPQHDEYESTATNTGLWSLNPSTGELILLQHSPSGSFGPLVDSYGRILFTRWDHLQRDQQADSDALGGSYGTFDYSEESAGAALLPRQEEVFPEPREERTDLLAGTPLEGHRFNHFSPWMILPDGTGEETLNHIGRHELHDYFNRVRNDDANLDEFIAAVSGRFNPNSIQNLFQIAEDPSQAGRYFGTEAPEFGTHAAGQVVSLEAPPERRADAIAVTYHTHPDTGTTVDDGATPPATHSGHYRDPLPLSDGQVLAAHTFETRYAGNDGSRANPDPRYKFRMRLLQTAGSFLEAGSELTGGIVETLSYWDPDVLVSYSGELWELSPVEVRSRPQPALLSETALAAPEAQIFAEEQVDPELLRSYLRDRGLALIVSRDITTRDVADQQQPYNLAVAGGGT